MLSVADEIRASYQVTPAAVVTTVAGTAGVAGSADGIPGSFNSPQDVAVDTATNSVLYVADTMSHTIRQVSLVTGIVSTWVGTAGSAGSLNGTGSAASFSSCVRLHRRHA